MSRYLLEPFSSSILSLRKFRASTSIVDIWENIAKFDLEKRLPFFRNQRPTVERSAGYYTVSLSCIRVESILKPLSLHTKVKGVLSAHSSDHVHEGISFSKRGGLNSNTECSIRVTHTKTQDFS